MNEIKIYRSLTAGIVYLLLPLVLIFSSCSQHKREEKNYLLSMIISGDSVIVYTGELRQKSSSKKIPVIEKDIKSLFVQKKKVADKDLVLLLKLSLEEVRGGFMDKIADVIRWAKVSGINDIELAEPDKNDQAIFGLPAATWWFIDSLASESTLQLNMPKDEEPDIKKIDRRAPYVLSVIVSSPDNWYCYPGADSTSGSLFSRNEYSALLKEKKKNWGEKLIVLVSIAPGAEPESIIAALEEKANNKIRNYELVFPPPAPRRKRKLTAEDFLFKPPSPVTIETPGTIRADHLPEDSAFLIEIHGDQSVWYQPITKNTSPRLSKVNNPITQTLGQIIADYQSAMHGHEVQYLIKGDKNVRYPVFEKVINALKENNIYKYDLVTIPEN